MKSPIFHRFLKCFYDFIIRFSYSFPLNPSYSDILSSSGDCWKYSKVKRTTEHFFISPCGGKVFLMSSSFRLSYTSHFVCVPKCLGSKPVSCGVRFSSLSLFIFPLIVSSSVLVFSHRPTINKSAFLIRLGKHKTSRWLQSQEGKNLHFNKMPSGGCCRPGRQTTCFLVVFLITGVACPCFRHSYFNTACVKRWGPTCVI